ncbi:HlyD family efflux transporter periplasmic adaptor subunit [Demequina gelatinilytica]|uniref:HlyD family efflux transporter periplasmic adaptor subunit n=1 Tax=Demequina gelatinilytica TaxID=1638980 RepID=UPI000783F04C|nr:HlyD family efflux transporter periplasmic adaptor subunit [Demequina gelatinilytica]
MTWGNRFKLVAGMLVVLLIVAAATLVFNRRQTQVLSSSAQIQAQQYDVGSDYGGLVLETFVEEGDTVLEGQRLFTIESAALRRDIRERLASVQQGRFDKDGTVTVRANVDGTLTAFDVDAGSFAGTGAVMATIDATDSEYVEATFELTTRDFARVPDSAPVELRLPDGTTVTGEVEDFQVETIDGGAVVTARIDSDELLGIVDTELLQPGTPLDATLELRDDGPLADVTAALGDLARRVGL